MPKVMVTKMDCPFSRQNTLSYLTTGTLSGVKRLQTRKVGVRCTGLCIYHEDGLIEALGQWDPSDGNPISNIYDHSDGPLVTIGFRYSWDDLLSSCISGIFVNEESETH